MSNVANPRKIPKAPFIDDVEKHVGGPEADVEEHMNNFQGAIAKYRFMENNLTQRKGSLEEKIPDIKKTLAMVVFMQGRREGKSKASSDDDEDDLEDDLDDDEPDKEPLTTTFGLNDTLYAEAELEDSDTVFLWLGANVMLSYKLPAAIALLQCKLRDAQSSLESIIADLDFLREQLTIMEVNTARLYNWDVKRRRDKRLKTEAEDSGGKRKSNS